MPDYKWTRKGLLLPVKAGHQWWASHAQSPTVLALSSRLWRIYFAGRDAGNLSSMMAVDVDPLDGMRILAEHLDAIMVPGPPGTFDSSGLGPSCALIIGGRIHLYYSGIYPRLDVRTQLAIGLAISDDGLTFERISPGPVRGIGPKDPYFVSTPFVSAIEGGYRMWYTSGTGWMDVDGSREPVYGIRSCISEDGILWETGSSLCLHEDADEGASLTRPWVTQGDDGMRLWYSRRGKQFRNGGNEAYRLFSRRINARGDIVGEAEPVIFSNSPVAGDFDSWMQAYGCVMQCASGEVMFYNGNGFGQDGIGWATRDLR
ncbi:hypothetical protein [Mesorhizobium sp. BH1-1-4]|uniref:hypothetical protein n=1 Tax=Mesorhizobium sp. BH1-1-4 TaxID=2876662 RepID=UPI001CD0A352|nr:hypothetical protein [Mesorhizobium sp. BH1-1-4]MBZ9993446.1 hypothetical protein [Mesorhizobium sp. BH1-1-4]